MTNNELAKKIVDRMLDIIDNTGYLPWTKPWNDHERRNTVKVNDGVTTITIPVTHWSRSGRPYTGINPMLLNCYGKSGEMITFNQCKAEGGHIKAGAKGAPVVYWNFFKKELDELDENGKRKVVTIPFLKTYTVFSVEHDCEGIKPKHHPDPIVITRERFHWEPVAGTQDDRLDPAAEAVIASYIDRAKTLRLQRDGVSDRAYFSPSQDLVVVPCINQFDDAGEFYSTMFHELGHSTGHASRLNRFSGDGKIAAFGDDNYSREELVAEITSASILSTLNLESGNTFRNSAAYVKSWSEKLRKDPMLFVTAAGRAEKAIDMILGTEAEAC